MLNGKTTLTALETQTLQRMVEEVLLRLQQQRDQLRPKGMDVPKGVIHQVELIRSSLEEIGPLILEQYNELERLRALAKTTSVVNSTLDLDGVLGVVMETVLQLLGAERGYIMLRNPHDDQLEVRIVRGISEHDDGQEALSFSQTIVEEVVQTGAPIMTTNAQSDERFASQQSVIGYNLRSILCVPLVIKGRIEGVIYVDNRVLASLFDKKELQLLSAIASQSALAIENARLFAQVNAALHEIIEVKTLLDNILSSIVSGVITTDGQDFITTYNLSAEHILEWPSDGVAGQPFEAIAPEIYKQIQKILPKVRNQGSAVTLEAETQDQQQETRYLNLRVSALRDQADHQTQGIALVVDDMTELRKRDATLQAVRRYLPPVMVENIQSIEGIGLGGERRTVTILFVDVRPLDLFPPNFSAPQVMERLNLYLTVGTDAIHRRAGLIDKYMGSEIMALFNTQLNPSESHAGDAVLAALELMANFKSLHEQLGEANHQAYYRIGIHTGVATIGNVGGVKRREFTAIGDTVNLAKRLQENAAPGQLIVSEDTYQASREQLASLPNLSITPREALQVKGRSQATAIFEIGLSV